MFTTLQFLVLGRTVVTPNCDLFGQDVFYGACVEIGRVIGDMMNFHSLEEVEASVCFLGHDIITIGPRQIVGGT